MKAWAWFWKHVLRNKLVWFDLSINVWLLWGNPHETISQHAAFTARDGRWWGCVLCELLDRINPNHCENAIAGVNRAGNYEG